MCILQSLPHSFSRLLYYSTCSHLYFFFMLTLHQHGVVLWHLSGLEQLPSSFTSSSLHLEIQNQAKLYTNKALSLLASWIIVVIKAKKTTL